MDLKTLHFKEKYLNYSFDKYFEEVKKMPNYTYLGELDQREVDLMRMGWMLCAEKFQVMGARAEAFTAGAEWAKAELAKGDL